ncbi:MAG: argininosuccinate synthase, partial [Dechloromonas sp.]|nr:argininosuccinate synthase [Dechloromonas sp.]
HVRRERAPGVLPLPCRQPKIDHDQAETCDQQHRAGWKQPMPGGQPAAEAEESMWRWTVSPEKAPNKAEYLDLEFAKGDVVAVNGKKLKAHEVLALLNELGGKHGIGRLDLVENRYVGMKSRGCYETPGGTILLRAHRAIESITLDREVAHLKDDLMPRYASLVYNGYWWSPERKALQVLIDHTQQTVNGTVRLKLYKGNVIVVGRDSKTDSLFDSTIATFEDDAGAYDQRDAGGFIKLNALRMRIAANLTAKKAGKSAAAKKAAPKKETAVKPAAKVAAKPAAKTTPKAVVKPVAAKAVVKKAVAAPVTKKAAAPAKAVAKKPAAKKKG